MGFEKVSGLLGGSWDLVSGGYKQGNYTHTYNPNTGTCNLTY